VLNRPSSQKIRPDHLDRLAVIYVRQSTLFQVRENTGSTTRQYDLVKRAQDLGWTPAHIQVVDQDQGHSGSSAVGRDGFQWLVAEVGLGHVGAVLSLEVSRLARSCSDWYRLLEICALTDTLVIDDEGVPLRDAVAKHIDDGGGAGRERADMQRQHHVLRHHVALRVHQRAGRILRLPHDGGEAGAEQRILHLLHDAGEARLHHFEIDRVDGHCVSVVSP